MTTWKARTLIWLLRNRHLFKGRLRPEAVGPDFDVAGFRASTARAVARMPPVTGVVEVPVEVAGMPGAWLVPEGAPADRALFYIHGGGFISGGVETHRVHVAKFARAIGVRALVFDYRLAPEHPFPAAPDDVERAWDWLLAQGFAPEQVVVGGESAGATLALGLVTGLAQRGGAQPAGCFSISPVADLSLAAASFATNAARDIAPPGSAETWCAMYAGDTPRDDPRLSPLFADYTGLAPLYLCVGGAEIHRDDVRAVAQKARAAGVAVTLDEVADMVHAFPIFAPMFLEASRAHAAICAFAQERLAL